MERNLKEVFHEAAQLPERDRATLAGLLIETLDPISEPDVEAAWSEEIKRRVAEIDAGTVELIPWEEVRAERNSIPVFGYDGVIHKSSLNPSGHNLTLFDSRSALCGYGHVYQVGGALEYESERTQ